MIQPWIYSKLSHQAEVSLEANRQNYSAILSVSRSVLQHLNLQLTQPKQHVTPAVNKNYPLPKILTVPSSFIRISRYPC